MVVRNEMDRFSLQMTCFDRIPRLKYEKAYVKQIIHNKLIEHKQYIHEHGDDMPEIRD